MAKSFFVVPILSDSEIQQFANPFWDPKGGNRPPPFVNSAGGAGHVYET